ncbi:MAG: heavy-metal-associated domain-containing protein [Paracoccaceae bacterium]
MKRFLLAFSLLAALASPALAGQTQTIKFFIPGMTGCPSCPYIVKSVLSGVDGVSQVETVYATGIATIVYDDEATTPDDLRKALDDYGYDAETVAPEG